MAPEPSPIPRTRRRTTSRARQSPPRAKQCDVEHVGVGGELADRKPCSAEQRPPRGLPPRAPAVDRQQVHRTVRRQREVGRQRRRGPRRGTPSRCPVPSVTPTTLRWPAASAPRPLAEDERVGVVQERDPRPRTIKPGTKRRRPTSNPESDSNFADPREPSDTTCVVERAGNGDSERGRSGRPPPRPVRPRRGASGSRPSRRPPGTEQAAAPRNLEHLPRRDIDHRRGHMGAADLEKPGPGWMSAKRAP